MEKRERNSGIELLKIFAVVIIAFSHAMPVKASGGGTEYVMDLRLATDSIQRIIIVLFKYGGFLGNDIFIISSAWFLLESSKMNIKKVFYMMGDCFAVSVVSLFIFLSCGYEIGVKEIIKQFMPTYMAANWFICCYLLFYAAHPMLNIIISQLTKEGLLIVNAVMLFLYAGLQFLRPDSMYYSRLIGFICIYFLTAYVKKYLKKTAGSVKRNRMVLVLSAIGNLFLIGATDILGLHIDLFSTQLTRWVQLMNPFLITAAFALFLLANEKKFVNKKINYLSGLSMLIYIIHCNRLIMDHLIGDIYRYIYNTWTYQYELAWVCLIAVILIVFGTSAGILYRYTLQKFVYKICDLIYRFLEPVSRRFIAICLRFE